jgi:hypothetical protein
MPTGVERGSEPKVVGLPAALAGPSTKVGRQAGKEGGKVFGVPHRHGYVADTSVEPVSVGIDGEDGFVLVNDLAVEKPDADIRISLAMDNHVR